MENLIIPQDYKSELSLHDTQLAIKTVKDFFQGMLAQRLSLTRVSAPLFVDPDTGLNDNLNGYERPVAFGIKEQNEKTAEVISIASRKIADTLKSSRLIYTSPVTFPIYSQNSNLLLNNIVPQLFSSVL